MAVLVRTDLAYECHEPQGCYDGLAEVTNLRMLDEFWEEHRLMGEAAGPAPKAEAQS